MAAPTTAQRQSKALVDKAIELLEEAYASASIQEKHFLVELADRYISLANMGG